jgi:hypothetical protein
MQEIICSLSLLSVICGEIISEEQELTLKKKFQIIPLAGVKFFTDLRTNKREG